MAEYIEKNTAITRLTALEISNPCITITDAKQQIVDICPADVVPVIHGWWEWFDEDVGTPVTGYEREWGWRCSHCREELPDDYDDPDCRPEFRFCPNCGAKMDSYKEEVNA